MSERMRTKSSSLSGCSTHAKDRTDGRGREQAFASVSKLMAWCPGSDPPWHARAHLQLDAHRQPPLQLGQKIRRLGHMEGARAHKEHVGRRGGAAARAHAGALDEREELLLHALNIDVHLKPKVGDGNGAKRVQFVYVVDLHFSMKSCRA